MKWLVPALSLSAVTACGAGARAAEPPTDLGAVVVTATRTPTPLGEIGDSITLVTAEDIAARQETTLPEVLNDAPGLNVVQTGGRGGQTSVFLRGTNANHVKVLIDGVDVSDASSPNGAFDFGQVPTAGIARVEVLRGPQSGLYGSDAIGGVINIITRRGEGPPRFSAGLEGGSFGTFDQKAGAVGSAGAFHYAADIVHLRSDATPVTPLDVLGPGERRIDDAYDNITASARLGYEVSRDFELGLVARYTDARLLFTGDNFLTGFPDAAHSETDALQSYVRATVRLSAFAGRLDQTAGVAYGSSITTEAEPDNPTSYFHGQRVKADWQGTVRLARGEILVLGAEHQHDGAREPVTAAMDTGSGYAELQSNPVPNLHATIAVRYDASSGFGGQVTWRFAPSYLIAATGTRLKASVGTGFKAPTLSERFQDFPAFGFFGNPDLKPETSLGYDVGFEQSLPGSDVLRFGATWYRNAIRNLIDDNATFSSYANVGRAHTQGLEAFLTLKPAKAVSLRLDYTGTEAEDDVRQQALLRRPRAKWTLDARWQAAERLSLEANLLSVSRWIDANRQFTIPRLVAPGYTALDLAVAYDLTGQVTLYGRVANLSDARSQDPVGFLPPGRGVFAGVRARF